MYKLGILIDDVLPRHINKEIFRVVNEIYKKDKNSSISIFVRNINWPYKPLNYGLFRWGDYQNFSGTTLVTNLDLLNFVVETPNNNKISMYCHDFPWINCKTPAENVIKLLTNPKFRVYSRVEYIKDLVNTFRQNACETMSLEKVIEGLLYDKI